MNLGVCHGFDSASPCSDDTNPSGFHRFYVPTLRLKIDREQEALRLKAQDEEDEANGIAPGIAAADNVKGVRVQLDLHSGREVTEVDWAALLDGSRVLDLLYRLEVHLFHWVELG